MYEREGEEQGGLWVRFVLAGFYIFLTFAFLGLVLGYGSCAGVCGVVALLLAAVLLLAGLFCPLLLQRVGWVHVVGIGLVPPLLLLGISLVRHRLPGPGDILLMVGWAAAWFNTGFPGRRTCC